MNPTVAAPERESREEARARRRRLGGRIAGLRNARGWTQAELARHLRIPPSRLSRIESGQTDPLFRDLIPLRQVFGVPLDALVAGETGSGTAVADVRLRELLGELEAAASPEILDALVAVLRPLALQLALHPHRAGGAPAAPAPPKRPPDRRP
jgi:transcriptional regulator with XRE-family HTH domain